MIWNKSMDFQEYKLKILDLRKKGFVNNLQDLVTVMLKEHNIPLFFAGIAEEAGEVNGVWKRVLKGVYSTEEEFLHDVTLEIGDTLGYLILLTDALGIDWEHIYEKNLEKCRDRYSDKQTEL